MSKSNGFDSVLQLNLLDAAEELLSKGKKVDSNKNTVNTTLDVINVITVDDDQMSQKKGFILTKFKF